LEVELYNNDQIF